MPNRPLSVAIAAALLLVGAALGLAAHLTSAIPIGINAIGIACSVFLFRRQNWARWLALVWVATHIILAGLGSLRGLIVHGAIFVLFASLLLHPAANAYFRSKKGGHA